jgi:hypothetical protein
MSFIFIAKQPDLPGANKLSKYYETNIVKIADILERKKSDILRNIALYFEEGEGAVYNREEKKIIYRYQKGNSLLTNKGRLIHEAAHVVQDYQCRLTEGHALWCWVEGIADYCRLKLDPEFRTDTILLLEPEKGYEEAAYFLEWLSSKHSSIVADFNLLIHDKGLMLKGHDQIFYELLQTSFKNLKREYIYYHSPNQT